MGAKVKQLNMKAAGGEGETVTRLVYLYNRHF